MVFDLEALDVLAADVDDEVHLRTEERCRLEVRHGFHNAEVHAQSGTDEILAVAGDGAAADGAVRTQRADSSRLMQSSGCPLLEA